MFRCQFDYVECSLVIKCIMMGMKCKMGDINPCDSLVYYEGFNALHLLITFVGLMLSVDGI